MPIIGAMNLHRLLLERVARGRPVRVALIGAGKFGAMYLAQARVTPGVHIVGIADLDRRRAIDALSRCGWPTEQWGASSVGNALRNGTTFLTDDAAGLIEAAGIEIVIEATGDPAAGIRHALACSAHGKHVVMVNVEADALAGPLLAQRARAAGIVYSLAYGDQPAMICELVDWARTAGFEVVAAGKGTKYLPGFHESTPDTVWEHYGFSPAQVEAGDFNARMFNSFLDGTKSAIEMAAVANATGLMAAPAGLGFPPCAVDDLPRVLRPRECGGELDKPGLVEVVSCLERDGRPVPRDLRWGVYVVFRAVDGSGRDYVEECFRQYGLVTDDTARYCAMYRPSHLIGLELGVSVASVALRRESTGAPITWNADVVATAKRDLRVGELLDGEGGYAVFGRLMPTGDSLRVGGLPIGLAHRVRLRSDVPKGKLVCWDDVELDMGEESVLARREMEALIGDSLFHDG